MGSNTFTVIKYEDIPLNKHGDICHSCIVCKVQPKKDDPNKIRITIAGGNILYPGEVVIPTGSPKLTKLTMNNVLSRPGAHFACCGIKYIYLDTTLLWKIQSTCVSSSLTSYMDS